MFLCVVQMGEKKLQVQPILLSAPGQWLPRGCSIRGAQWATDRDEPVGEWVFRRLEAFTPTEPALDLRALATDGFSCFRLILH